MKTPLDTDRADITVGELRKLRGNLARVQEKLAQAAGRLEEIDAAEQAAKEEQARKMDGIFNFRVTGL